MIKTALFFCFALPHLAFAGDVSSTEITVLRPQENVWYTGTVGGEGYSAIKWGIDGDVPVPADYDGDGIVDIAVWRPSNSVWYINRSSDSTIMFYSWGMTSVRPTGLVPDVPVIGDFDGDGIDDITVWRPDTGIWYALVSSTDLDPAKPEIFKWGMYGDIPVPEDFDGDGRTDFAVFRPSENNWYILESASRLWRRTNFGLAGLDLLVPADYTGDGKAEVAIYREGEWRFRNSETGQVESFLLGFKDSVPVPGDYDNDGTTDLAVYFRGTWFIHTSETPRLVSFRFGTTTDVPLNSLRAKMSSFVSP